MLYLSHAGADTISVAFYAAALAGIRPGLTLTAGVLTHWALLPFALLELVRAPRLHPAAKIVAGYFLLGSAIIVLIATPYGGIVAGLVDGRFPLAFAQGLGAGLLIGLPAILVFRVGPVHLIGWVLGAAECGLQGHLQARYLLLPLPFALRDHAHSDMHPYPRF
jgi:hypothetical protein